MRSIKFADLGRGPAPATQPAGRPLVEPAPLAAAAPPAAPALVTVSPTLDRPRGRKET